LRTYTKFGTGGRIIMRERESRRDQKKWNPTTFPKEKRKEKMGGEKK